MAQRLHKPPCVVKSQAQDRPSKAVPIVLGLLAAVNTGSRKYTRD
jgi:hypothetical protein